MKCVKCGQELDEGSTFCGNCGQPIASQSQSISSQPIEPVQAQTQPEAPVQPAPTVEAQPNVSPVQTAEIPSQPPVNPVQNPVADNQQFSGVATTGMAAPSERGGGKAIASLVLGILGLIAWVIPILGLIMGVLAIIFGSLTLKSSRKGFAIAGLILGSIVVLISLFAWVYNVQQIRQEREKNPTAIIESLTAKVNY